MDISLYYPCDRCGAMPLYGELIVRDHGSIQQHRICRQCHAWCQTLLHEDPEVHGRSQRAYEGGFANWYQQVVRDTWASGLTDRDEAAVWNACYQAGRDFGSIALADTRFLPHETSRVAFVEAGQGRSLRAIKALPEAARRRVVIVARPDTIDEAMDALALGAGDVAVSPLSPEQVAGSFERVGGLSKRKRHAGTGLTVYPDTEPGAHGLPSNTLGISLPRQETVRGAFLRLRRFLRGYDRVGVDADGSLRVVVYCPTEHAAPVSERIQMVLGDGASVRVVGQGAPRALPGTAASAA